MIKHGYQTVVAVGIGCNVLYLEYELARGCAQAEIGIPFAGQGADRSGQPVQLTRNALGFGDAK